MKSQEDKQMASCRIYYTLSNCFYVPGKVLEAYEIVKSNDPALDWGFRLWYTCNFRDHIYHWFISCQKLTRFDTINTLHCSFYYCSFFNLPPPHLAILCFFYNITNFRIIKWQFNNAEWFSTNFSVLISNKILYGI